MALFIRKAFLLSAFVLVSGAHAEITRIEVLSSEPFGNFDRGAFARMEIRAHGELTVAAESTRELMTATPNAQGRVEYTTHITLITPADATHGNGTLLVDIPNRSRITAQALFNSPRSAPMFPGTVLPGNGFLQENGFTTAAIFWELGAKDVMLPAGAGADGQPMFVEAAALPIVRDVAAFLSRSRVDASGTPNPLAGRVQRTLAVGYSQSGRFLKTFLAKGQNQMNGQQVFNGLFIFGAATSCSVAAVG